MNRHLKGSVILPGSKSESNRALMIAAYGGFVLEAENLSTAHDTVLLERLLNQIASPHSDAPFVVDCEDAGTDARFLTTYLAGKQGRWLVTGTARMRQRPMKPLVEALRQMGAEIKCLDSEGFLPLLIEGKTLKGGAIQIDVSQSSQFVSSLMMAAPMWENGLDLSFLGETTSMPYIEMTVSMMRHFGAEVAWQGEHLRVMPQPYHPAAFTVASDWSAASYWYELAALSESCELFLQGLKPDFMQGDAIVSDWFQTFGIHTVYETQGTKIVKDKKIALDALSEPLKYDFTQTPDLFPTMLVTCVALHRPAVFTGIANLSLKESDRVESLITELSKYYTFINKVSKNEIVIDKSSITKNNIYNKGVSFKTYRDHRIAMALAPLCLRFEEVIFDDLSVVNKSYPRFWSDFKLIIKYFIKKMVMKWK